MSEASLERRCVQLAQRAGWRTLKLLDGIGWPDRVFLGRNGMVFFVEFKSPRGRLSSLQRQRIKWLQCRGHRCYVIFDQETFNEILETTRLSAPCR